MTWSRDQFFIASIELLETLSALFGVGSRSFETFRNAGVLRKLVMEHSDISTCNDKALNSRESPVSAGLRARDPNIGVSVTFSAESTRPP